MSGNNQPVWFDGPERELPPIYITAGDKKKFFRKGDGWKDCDPKDFQVVEGQIIKQAKLRRINADAT